MNTKCPAFSPEDAEEGDVEVVIINRHQHDSVEEKGTRQTNSKKKAAGKKTANDNIRYYDSTTAVALNTG